MSADSEGVEFVRPRVPHNGVVHLAEASPDWPRQYAAVATRIRAALEGLTITVEHAGSTSVPGLAAKPIIDVVLLVPDPADETGYVPALEAAGFLLHLREPGWHEHRLLRGSDPKVNVHVFRSGSEEAERMLLFRDRLHRTPRSGIGTSSPNASSRHATGPMSRTTQRRSPQWWRRSSPALVGAGADLGLLQPLVEAAADLLGLELQALALLARHDDSGGGDTGKPGKTEHLPELHDRRPFPWTRQC